MNGSVDECRTQSANRARTPLSPRGDSRMELLPWDYFTFVRDPPRILSKRGIPEWPCMDGSVWIGGFGFNLDSRSADFANAASLSSQCLHRIDPRCPPRRNQAGEHRHHQQRCSHRREDRRIERPGSIEHRLD